MSPKIQNLVSLKVKCTKFINFLIAEDYIKFKNKKTTYKKYLQVADILGEPEGIRTPNLLIRSQVHYPIMLQVHHILRLFNAAAKINIFYILQMIFVNLLKRLFSQKK